MINEQASFDIRQDVLTSHAELQVRVGGGEGVRGVDGSG